MAITFYGIVWAFAILTELFLIRSYLKTKNKNPDLAYPSVAIIILSSLIGARLLYALYYFPIDFSDPLKIFFIWNGGLSFHGGLLGGIIASYFLCKKYKVDFLEAADLAVIPLFLFLGIGRVANFFNSELYGKTTNFSWCFNFKNADGCRHASQIYEAISDIGIFFAALTAYFKSKIRLKKGVILFLTIFVYSLLRFLIDFSREYEKYFLGLGSGQYLGIIAIIVSGYFLTRRIRSNI